MNSTLSLGLSFVMAACSSSVDDAPTLGSGGRTGAGGSAANEGGMASTTGGNAPSEGGASSGGASVSSGGSGVSFGGNVNASGGTVASMGGKFSGAGGTVASMGGKSSGAGGTVASMGGKFSGMGGTVASAGGKSSGAGGAGTAMGGAGTSTANDPILPPISGDCPTFKSGTATIGGLGGIQLQVGAKQAGTGSLLFYWHGTGSSAGEVNTLVPKAVRDELLAQGGIIVSFQSSLGTGGDCSGTSTFSKDDFKIADLIAACAVRDYAIDPRRIYTTGCSAGGLQAGCMGALRSSYIAATVPNSGGLVSQQPLQDRARVPSVMTMHGGTSDRVVVSFATTSATYDSQMKTSGSFVVNCNHGGGHCQAPAALYSAGWQFMKDHPFGAKPEPYGAGLPTSFPSYCQTY